MFTVVGFSWIFTFTTLLLFVHREFRTKQLYTNLQKPSFLSLFHLIWNYLLPKMIIFLCFLFIPSAKSTAKSNKLNFKMQQRYFFMFIKLFQVGATSSSAAIDYYDQVRSQASTSRLHLNE